MTEEEQWLNYRFRFLIRRVPRVPSYRKTMLLRAAAWRYRDAFAEGHSTEDAAATADAHERAAEQPALAGVDASERITRAWYENDALISYAILRSEPARKFAGALVHELIGNPFRHVVFDPAWRSSDVMLLAAGIYDERAFDQLPILADALQEAGCDSDELLNHFRAPEATHVRGCWALDLVLGKE